MYEKLVGKRALVVEDNPSYAHFLRLQLNQKGMDAHVAGSYDSALNYIDTAPNLDISLVDMYIPAFDGEIDRIQRGEELCYVIKRSFPDSLIVGLSSNFDSAPNTPVREIFDQFIFKGDLQENDPPVLLWETIEHLLNSRQEPSPRIFLVHGRDESIISEVRSIITHDFGLRDPIVLREQPDGGKTIIEKFESLARQADIVIACLTPDDVVVEKDLSTLRRSRPNVIFEAGFFYGKLQRRSGRVFLLTKGTVEIPTDLSGIVWIDTSNDHETLTDRLELEFRALGFDVTANPTCDE